MEKLLQTNIFLAGIKIHNQLTERIRDEVSRKEQEIDNLKSSVNPIGFMKRLFCLNQLEVSLEEARKKLHLLEKTNGLIVEAKTCIERNVWQDTIFWVNVLKEEFERVFALFMDKDECHALGDIFNTRVRDFHNYLEEKVQLGMF